MSPKMMKQLIKLMPGKKLKQKLYDKFYIHGDNKIIGERPQRLAICIYGDNNQVNLGKNLKYFRGELYIGSPDIRVDNCIVTIGDDCTSNGVVLRLMEDNSRIEIGHDCMFSSGIDIFCSDTHSILQNNEVINEGKNIEIGNHVWVGMDAKIGKNSKISENSVVGWNSVVTKIFEAPGVIIAGNPAKIIKENINWDRKRPKELINQNLMAGKNENN